LGLEEKDLNMKTKPLDVDIPSTFDELPQRRVDEVHQLRVDELYEDYDFNSHIKLLAVTSSPTVATSGSKEDSVDIGTLVGIAGASFLILLGIVGLIWYCYKECGRRLLPILEGGGISDMSPGGRESPFAMKLAQIELEKTKSHTRTRQFILDPK